MCSTLPTFQEFEAKLRCKEVCRWENVILPRLGKQSASAKFRRREWTLEEDLLLLKLVQQAELPISWQAIANALPGRSRDQCRSHWLNRLDPRLLNETAWTEAEDALVLQGVLRFGYAWTKIARSLKGRPAPQIRARFLTALQPLYPALSGSSSQR